MVILLRFCALGSGAGFCENTVLVMRPYFRGGAAPILQRENRISGNAEFSWGLSPNSFGRIKFWARDYRPFHCVISKFSARGGATTMMLLSSRTVALPPEKPASDSQTLLCTSTLLIRFQCIPTVRIHPRKSTLRRNDEFCCWRPFGHWG